MQHIGVLTVSIKNDRFISLQYRVRLEKEANKFYQAANKVLTKKLNKCFEVLENNPYQHPNIKALKGSLKGKYRYRVGDYRVIYKINKQQIEVLVLLIKPRGNAY